MYLYLQTWIWTPCILQVVHSFGRANQQRRNSATSDGRATSSSAFGATQFRIHQPFLAAIATRYSCCSQCFVLWITEVELFHPCCLMVFTFLSKTVSGGQKNILLSATIQQGCGRFMVAWVHLRECCCIAMSLDCHSVDLF